MQFSSDESYDVEIIRKDTGDFSSSDGLSYISYPLNVYKPSYMQQKSISIQENFTPKYAITLCDFKSVKFFSS